jgi:hypothetical protein
MKLYFLSLLVFISSCTKPLSQQEKDLEVRVNALSSQIDVLSRNIDVRSKLCDSLTQQVHDHRVKREIYNTGKTPVYIVTLHFQEHKMEISWDRISFNFEIPVDEFFYNECKVGEQLGSGRRTMKLLHSGDITIVGKRIDCR